jgi:type II secretory ATPase GspE/PulE/Tfp pilus assembly ATPase PilB-like protein
MAATEVSTLLFEDTWLPLDDGEPLWRGVEPDSKTADLVAEFDYQWDGLSEFIPARVPDNLPLDYGLGVIVGASGAGKSTMLRGFGRARVSPGWNRTLAIAGHFASADDG